MLSGWTTIASVGGSNRRKSFAVKSVATLVAVCGLTIAVGCEREPDQVAKAIADARNTLVAANGNGGAALAADGREKAYSKVISSLQSVASNSERPGSQAAAKMLIAQAQAGQGEIAAAKARRSMSRIVLAVSDARAQLELYQSQRALGDSLSAESLSSDDTLAGELAVVEQQIAAKQQAIADAQSRLAELQQRASALGTQAQETRRAADEGRADLSTLTAQQRAARVTEITARHREADGLERQQANVSLDAEDAQRGLDSLNRQLEALNDQKNVIQDAQGRIAEMAQLRGSGRSDAHAKASETAGEIEKLVAEIKRTLDEELKPAMEEAVSKYSSASSSSKQAQKEFQGSAQAANYDHVIAGLQVGFAEAVEVTIGVIQRLADASPEMPGAENYRRMVSTLENDRKVALEAAGEAYASASGGFQSARAQGRTSEIFQSLGEQLARHERRIKGEPDPAPEGETPPTDDAAPVEETPAEEAPVEEAPATDGTMGDEETPSEVPADEGSGEEPASEPTPEPEQPGEEPTPEPAPETP